ncbi:helix-turn-helix transcriptional regulator [Polluticaenibacter yanchengensis]|uniref:LuxR C-terminal-related transcriptional regulator n=1 Tax=Polluticaenibacter yanchengensis TaxID=3014562 RepID=A0ABT4UEQ8_9BACT|nr:LuxR C-terminal-related transcriptional regulator [Chitinophagaceae bacterium LY-5]
MYKIAILLDEQTLFLESLEKVISDLKLFDFIYTFKKESDLIQFLIHFRTRKELYFFLDYYVQDRIISMVLKDIRPFIRNGKIIIVSSIKNALLLKELTALKPHGIVSKFDRLVELIESIKEIANGSVYYSTYTKALLDTIISERISFTPRELELLNYFNKGLSVDATAKMVSLSRHTVAAHRRKMFAKANCNSITELLNYVKKMGLFDTY